jgi:hypothetical protein
MIEPLKIGVPNHPCFIGDFTKEIQGLLLGTTILGDFKTTKHEMFRDTTCQFTVL